jgi:hypothetical protein
MRYASMRVSGGLYGERAGPVVAGRGRRVVNPGVPEALEDLELNDAALEGRGIAVAAAARCLKDSDRGVVVRSEGDLEGGLDLSGRVVNSGILESRFMTKSDALDRPSPFVEDWCRSMFFFSATAVLSRARRRECWAAYP